MAELESSKLLVVDDDEGLLRLVRKALEREGLPTATARTGAEATQWLKQHAPELLLLDLKLPDMEGKDLITHISSVRGPIPFIVITGQGDERVAVEMMKSGALDYLVKDAQFLDLLPTVVQRALNQVQRDGRLAVAEKQARLAQTIVEQAYSAVLVTGTDPLDPEIVYANPAFNTLAGLEPGILVGQPLSRLEAVTGQFIPLHWALDSGREFTGETQIRVRTGEQRFVDCNIVKVVDSTGTQTHWAVILRDVTTYKELQREVLEITDQEQRRIGLDLHDGLGQQLTGLEFFTAGLKEEIEDPRLAEALSKIGRELREAISQTRALASGLSPVALHRDTLISALQKLADGTREMARVKCKFSSAPGIQLPDTRNCTQLYRIAQEAVNNALKHGRPKSITITLEESGGGLQLKIRDDGAGFSPEKVEGGLGVRAMRYRADLIGATLNIDSAPRKGTAVSCTLAKRPIEP